MTEATLYTRLGGYDAIAAVVANLLPRLMADSLLARFWQNRGDDGLQREEQLLVDFLSNAAGGPMYYTGREMKVSHKGMGVTAADWNAFIGHLEATLDSFNLPAAERADVLGFIDSTRADIVE